MSRSTSYSIVICLSAATSQLMVSCSDRAQVTPAESLAQAKRY